MGRNNWLIRNVTVYGETKVFERGYVRIKDGKIDEIGEESELTNRYNSGEEETRFEEGFICVPGFIDVHIHGAAGADVMDATPEALRTIASSLPAEGTTSFLATTMTLGRESIEKALVNAGRYRETQEEAGSAEMLGIHLEGPFLSPEKAGAQPIEHIIEPDVALFERWQHESGGCIRLVTLAPERNGGLSLIRHLAAHDIVASIGHSKATYEEAVDGAKAGATHVTHLFNGMSGLHHREPGVAGAALLRKELTAELIVDGIHSRPEIIELAYRMKGKDGLVLITDSMRAKCLKNGTYDLGGQTVVVENGQARLANGRLAGSVLKMKDALRNLIHFTGCSIAEAVQMGSLNPARQLKISDRKGSLAPGKDADMVILDDSMQIVMTLCRGEVAYDRERDLQ
ncbi:MAG TPA: N-acetylglucosamine-6-phosphate deacetylase [Bacillales bacterium]|nr:N-acetylglucosamine-6-phosphate deacetylase [Bacillales bacterium]